MRHFVYLRAVLFWLFASSTLLAQGSATKLETLKLLPNELGLLAIVQGDGTLSHRIVEEQTPGQRLIIDILGVSNPLRHYYPPEAHPLLERVLMYEYPAATNPNQTGPLARIVFEMKTDVRYDVQPQGNEIHIVFMRTSEPLPQETMPMDVDDPDGGGDHAGDLDGPSDLEAPPEPEDPLVPPKVNIEPTDIPPSFFFHAALESGDDYQLGPEDVIEVRVFELDQLNRTLRVSGNGLIDLPLVGSIRATGLTAEEVGQEIAARLRDRYVQNPQVNIFIREFKSQKVSLLGAVNTPATYPLVGQRRLLQLLAEAGSLGPEAGRTLYVFRQTSDGRSARLTVPLSDLLLQGDPRWNIMLRAGDVISVPPEQAIAISVLGAVASPGVHKLPVGNEATLLKVIALAGGLNERASKKGIQIKRRDEDENEMVIKVNLGDILSGKEPDFILREGDVVVVNESFF